MAVRLPVFDELEIGTVYDLYSDKFIPGNDQSESDIENVGTFDNEAITIVTDESIREEFGKCNLPVHIKIKLLGKDFNGQPSFVSRTDIHSRSVRCQWLYVKWGAKKRIKDFESLKQMVR